jgi:predicted DsbA family dithiol-disulfide isomerase
MNQHVESHPTSRVLGAAPDVHPSVIEIVSDVVCPWCFVGKRRLEKALALLDRQDLTVRWKPFQLNPDAPKEGMDQQAHRARKFGSLARARELETHVSAVGAEEGIQFQFDRIQKIPNTFEAHRLIWFAVSKGVQDAVVDKLFRAYFLDAEDVGEIAVLKRIGAESGLDSGGLEELFTNKLGTAEVLAEEEWARSKGVGSVPTFFVNGEPVTAGAHKPELLAAFLGQVLQPVQSQCSPLQGICL